MSDTFITLVSITPISAKKEASNDIPGITPGTKVGILSGRSLQPTAPTVWTGASTPLLTSASLNAVISP